MAVRVFGAIALLLLLVEKEEMVMVVAQAETGVVEDVEMEDVEVEDVKNAIPISVHVSFFLLCVCDTILCRFFLTTKEVQKKKS